MSIANVFMQQITSGKTPPLLKKSLIDELSTWKDKTTPLCSMGGLFDGSVRDRYLINIKELVQEQVSSKECATETLFWLYYLAKVLEFELPITTGEEKTAKDFLARYLEETSKDIEAYISTIKLN